MKNHALPNLSLRSEGWRGAKRSRSGTFSITDDLLRVLV